MQLQCQQKSPISLLFFFFGLFTNHTSSITQPILSLHKKTSAKILTFFVHDILFYPTIWLEK